MNGYKCIVCGKDLEGNQRKYCSRQCYFAKWYKENKKELNQRRKNKYIKHPRILLTEEEKIEHKKQSYKKYAEKNKEKIKEIQHKYHETHKNEEKYRETKRKNARNYYNKYKVIKND